MSQPNDPALVTELESGLLILIGLECWSVKQGVGSFVDFDFGQKNLRQYPLRNPSLSEEERLYVGERGLFVNHAPWRIEHDGGIVGSWNDDNALDGLMQRNLKQFIGAHVEQVELLRPGLDLTLYFTNALVFRLFCEQTESEETDNYVYFTPMKTYVVGTWSNLIISPNGEF